MSSGDTAGMRVCALEGCEEEFVPNSWNHLYHSEEHSKQATGEKLKENYRDNKARLAGKTRTCNTCGFPLSRYNKTRTCSSCDQKAERLRNEKLEAQLKELGLDGEIED